ncbi:MAG: MFS transporter [Chloroflexi bacterium]|nr:MFS transporter [Chloroflexota bacterium]
MVSESAWAPLRNGVFRALYLAVLASNIGTWMQTVGAQWLLVDLPNAALLVALVQVMDTLPDVLFSVVGGVLADTFDRRRMLIVVQACLVVVGSALTALTLANEMPPALLLTFTFLLGAGSAFSVPAYQAIVPDLVPRSQLSAASALSSVSINLGRAVGPAIAGILIARIGVGAVFALNTLTFLVYGVVVAAWHPPVGARPDLREHFLAALRAGTGYVRYAPVVRRVLLRAALFLVPASVLWALLALVASQQLGLGAAGYGLLLGALGAGAIAGAFLLPSLRARLDTNRLMLSASLAYALTLVVTVLVSNAAVILVILVVAGVAWVGVLSTINAVLQLFLPAWVRGRGLSIYQTVLFGAQAVGGLLAGLVAGVLGLTDTFLIAAVALVAGAVTIRWWPFLDIRGMDRAAAVYWPRPHMEGAVDPDSGPVVVSQTYTITPDKEQRFLQAMQRVRLSRLRTGATQWGLFRDGEAHDHFVELFVVLSWAEHLRQHSERLTGTDRQYEQEADALSDPPARISHLIAADLRAPFGPKPVDPAAQGP